MQALEELDAGDAGHLVIEQDEVEWSMGQEVQRLFCAIEAFHRVPESFELAAEVVRQVVVVVDNEDSGHGVCLQCCVLPDRMDVYERI